MEAVTDHLGVAIYVDASIGPSRSSVPAFFRAYIDRNVHGLSM
jgi:hypothetical protein